MESLRRKREALAAAQQAEAPPLPSSADVARAAVAHSLSPHAGTALAFTPVRISALLSLRFAVADDLLPSRRRLCWRQSSPAQLWS